MQTVFLVDIHTVVAVLQHEDYSRLGVLVCAKRFITISTNLYCSDPRPVFKEFGADTEAKVRYVRMHAYIPECESGWLFTDEIIIR